MDENYYKILGIAKDATEKEIKKAYHQLARDKHPDKASNPEERAEFEQLFASVSKAYNTLKDPEKRAEYDKVMKIESQKEKPAPRPQAFSSQRPKTEAKAETAGDILKSTSAASKQATVSPAERAKIAQKAYVKGVQLFNTQDYLKAIEFFDAAINNDNENPTYFAKYATCLIRAKKSFTKAVELMQTAIDMDPYNIEYKLQLGEIYESAGAVSKAKVIYEEILKWDQGNEKAKRKLSFLGFGEKKSESFFVNLFKSILKKPQR